MGYRQLTQIQRYQSFAYLETGISQRQIAKAMGVHSSIISREIKRNGLTSGYAPEQAQSTSDQRCSNAWKMMKRLSSLIRWVDGQLMDEWSPQQISGFMAKTNRICVSHQWFYALIWDDKKHGGELWKRLRLPCQRRYQRQLAKNAGFGKIPHRVGIDPAMTLTYRQEYVKAISNEAVPDVRMLQEWLATRINTLPPSQLTLTDPGFKLLSHCTEKANAPGSPSAWLQVFAAFGLEL
jgi:IS30 family transposase